MSTKGYFDDDEVSVNDSDMGSDNEIGSDDEIEDVEEEEGDEEEVEDIEENVSDSVNAILNSAGDFENTGEGDEDDDDDDDDDANYLQKFNSEINRNYIVDVHPECMIHNQAEIQALSVVVRNEYNIIIDELHKTIPFLTKFERARILGQRAKQINSGSKPFVEVRPDVIDGYKIAEIELEQKKIPFIIRRPLTNGTSEYWKVSDLENICF
jgi:DNA-directed RNA polymerase I, II, and III subunit RPABC2